LQMCNDSCIFMYVQGTITRILITHAILKYILKTTQHDT
jgi:hypothetical protein